MRLLSQSTRTTIRTLTLLFALTSLLLTMISPFVGTAHAEHVQPELRNGNPTCAELVESDGELRLESIEDGSNEDLSVDITVRNTEDGEVFDFEVTDGPDVIAVFVKGGSNGNLYDYGLGGTSADTGLHAPVNPKNDQYFGLSHISFCYNLDAAVTIVKDLPNNDGGTAQASDFELLLDGTEVVSGVATTVEPGTHTVSEVVPSELEGKYEPLGIDCGSFGSTDGTSLEITVEDGDNVVCTITNDDVPGSLTLLKDVVINDGGSAVFSDFTPTVSPSVGDINFQDADATNPTPTKVGANTYTLGEESVEGYELTEIDCGGFGKTTEADTLEVTIGLNEHVTCTFTNDDLPGHVEVRKVIIDPDELYPDVTQDDFAPTIGGVEAEWDTEVAKDPGTYDVGEVDNDGDADNDDGYLADGRFVSSTSCEDDDGGADATVTLGNTVICTITNTAVGSGLVLVKDVDTNWGGTLGPEHFTLLVNGDEVAEDQESVVFPAGTYEISELQEPGYEFVSLQCTEDSEPHPANPVEGEDETFTVNVAPGESVICTFTNRDTPASLTVLKDVTNDDGGTADETDFTPLVNTVEADWGSQDTTIGDQTGVPVGSYEVGEVLAEGYELSNITCSDETALAEDEDTVTVTLGHGDEVTCTIENDDVGSQLTLVKNVVTDDGGTATEEDFQPTLGYEPFDNPEGVQISSTMTPDAWGTHDVDAGIYTIGEMMLVDGYMLEGIECARGEETFAMSEVNELQIEIGLDDDVTCTITNNDLPPGLTVFKDVVNDDEGTAEPEDFTILVNGDEFSHGDTVDVEANTDYTVGEELLDDYELVDIECTDGTTLEEGESTVVVNLDNDEAVGCTITNDDVPPFEIVGEPTISADLLAPTCENDTPYLEYVVTVTNTDATTATIHWFDADGVEQHTDEVDSLSGRVLWPGAEVDEDDEPIDWPGWIQQSDGTWVEGDDGFEWARQDVQVAIEVNPTTDLMSVEYPPPTPLCDASPPEVEVAGEQFEQPAPELPRTGLNTGRMALWAALLAGLGALILLATDTPTATVRQRR